LIYVYYGKQEKTFPKIIKLISQNPNNIELNLQKEIAQQNREII
jgi:hypothetical protein